SGSGAMLKCGPLAAFARCDEQGLDFIVSKWGERAAPGFSVLCSAGPAESAGQLQVADRYIRGNDFVVSCQPAGQHCITPHLYWRAAFHKSLNAISIELVVSAQTDLLDSGPTWQIASFVRDASLFHCGIREDAATEDISSAVK